MANAAQSYASQVGMAATNTVNGTATLRFDFRTCNLGLHETFIDANGLRGTTSRVIERNLQGNRPCGGNLRLQPTAVEWSNLLEWMMGASPAGSPTVTYALADTRPLRSVVVDRITKVDTYASVGVGGWTLSGSENAALDLDLHLIGLDESEGNAGTFPALSLDSTTMPFKFTDCVIVANSVTLSSKDFRLTADYHVDTGRFFNSQTLTGIFSRDRTIMLEMSMPDCDAHTLYNLGRGGFAVTITATTGNSILTFSLVKVAVPRETPAVAERTEIMYPFRGQAFKSGSTLELVTTLNPTP